MEYQSFISDLEVRLEGLFLTRVKDNKINSLITRTALNKLEIKQCTLDPVNFLEGEDNYDAILPSIELDRSFRIICVDLKVYDSRHAHLLCWICSKRMWT